MVHARYGISLHGIALTKNELLYIVTQEEIYDILLTGQMK